MTEPEILQQFKDGVSLTEIERRSGFSRKKVTRICKEGAGHLFEPYTGMKRGPKVVEFKVNGKGAVDILRAPIGSIFDCGRLA